MMVVMSCPSQAMSKIFIIYYGNSAKLNTVKKKNYLPLVSSISTETNSTSSFKVDRLGSLNIAGGGIFEECATTTGVFLVSVGFSFFLRVLRWGSIVTSTNFLLSMNEINFPFFYQISVLRNILFLFVVLKSTI